MICRSVGRGAVIQLNFKRTLSFYWVHRHMKTHFLEPSKSKCLGTGPREDGDVDNVFLLVWGMPREPFWCIDRTTRSKNERRRPQSVVLNIMSDFYFCM